MKVIMFYRPKSEFARAAEEYIHEFRRRTDRKIDTIDVDSKEGTYQAQLYGIVDYPAFIAVSDSGQMLQAWSGKPLPLINELSAYAEEV